MISLKKLLNGIIDLPENFNLIIKGITSDSRLVAPGDLFFAGASNNAHRVNFINEAITRGAVAVISDGDTINYNIYLNTPLIVLPNLVKNYLGKLAARFYENPANNFATIVGVTGTNGKTSITQLLAQIFDSDDEPCAVIGTLGAGRYGNLISNSYTTPDAVTLQANLARLVTRGARRLFMEVSSHALDQGRVEGINFDGAIFTNLTHDHLDYHGNMELYGLAKQRLFQMPDLKFAIINTDDEFGRNLINKLADHIKVIGYGFSPYEYGTQLHIQGSELKLSHNGLSMKVSSAWGEGIVQCSLLGRFNALNILAVLATLCVLEMPFEQALLSLARVTPIAGRMETLGGGVNQPLVVIDYAHSPDSLKQALITLREHTKDQGRLWCVFGCGGERDVVKRPLMGAIAENLADNIIITNDNPRGENPYNIFNDIFSGIQNKFNVILVPDRALAIKNAIYLAKPGDVVLVAGKGHEDYQQIGKTRLFFSDRVEIKKALNIFNQSTANNN